MASLMTWHREKHRPHKGVPWDDRTIGDLLEEFFVDMALEARDLRYRAPDLDGPEARRLAELEDLISDEPAFLADLSPEETDELWEVAHRTGDPLADYWERQIARGEAPNLDLTEVPEDE
jgi:hypothetical protein